MAVRRAPFTFISAHEISRNALAYFGHVFSYVNSALAMPNLGALYLANYANPLGSVSGGGRMLLFDPTDICKMAASARKS
jgi:hypothetical protein